MTKEQIEILKGYSKELLIQIILTMEENKKGYELTIKSLTDEIERKKMTNNILKSLYDTAIEMIEELQNKG